ncbi:MAG: hypothetical protein RIM23_04650 [Coleofasciculus sp. G3-WIS-01]
MMSPLSINLYEGETLQVRATVRLGKFQHLRRDRTGLCPVY